MSMSLDDVLKPVMVPIHKEGHRFIAIAVIVTILAALMADALGVICALITAWMVYFFRDPHRVTPDKEGLVVAPADGVVQMIVQAAPPAELEMGEEELTRVSIFLNVFNVHVNRAPIGGTIAKAHYFPGAFLNASLDKASEENERNALKIVTADEKEVAVVQIAGLVARRIVCDVKEGDALETGERFGIIRFGSRTDIYLPKGVNPQVVEGQTMVGAETVIANMKGRDAARTGVVR